MRRLIGVLSLLIIGSFGINILALPILVKAEQIVVSQDKEEKKSFSQWLRELLGGVPESGGTQGEFCALLPGRLSSTTWSDRPIFFWKGVVTKIEVNTFNDEQLWSHNLTKQEQLNQSVIYGGLALEHGQEYTYTVHYRIGDRDAKTQPILLYVLGTEIEAYRDIKEKLSTMESPNSTMSIKKWIIPKGVWRRCDFRLSIVKFSSFKGSFGHSILIKSSCTGIVGKLFNSFSEINFAVPIDKS